MGLALRFWALELIGFRALDLGLEFRSVWDSTWNLKGTYTAQLATACPGFRKFRVPPREPEEQAPLCVFIRETAAFGNFHI